MELAGVRTGAFMAAAEVDGSTAVQIRPFMRAATRARCHSAPSFLRAGGIGYSRSAPVIYPANSLRTARRRSFSGSAFLKGPNFLRSAATGHSTDSTSQRRCPRAASEDNGNRFKEGGEFVDQVQEQEQFAGQGTDNVQTDSTPKVSPSFREKILAMLRSDLFKLLMLGVSVFIGCMAAKQDQIAIKVVEVCDKTHKVYNIASKALPVVLAFFKGDE